MAQDRKRGNRETKKPKQPKPKTVAEPLADTPAGLLAPLLKKKK